VGQEQRLAQENPTGGTKGAAGEVADLDLPSVTGTNQQRLIPKIVAANPNTVVVMKTEGQVNMPWIDQVHTMVQAWYPGQEDGNVVAQALFGVTNFSGKLPITIGGSDREAAYGTKAQYPGELEETGTPGGIGRDPLCRDTEEKPPCRASDPTPQRVVRYSEDLKMGYRWYEATRTKPLFPFGYGLSYTTFGYSDLAVTRVSGANGHTALQVEYTITNTGKRPGKEASQVYLTLPREADEPAKRLVQFEKIDLAPGESKRVSVAIDSSSPNHPFSYFVPANDNLKDWANGQWVTADGDYAVHVGGSSADTPLETTVALTFPNAKPTANDVSGVTVKQGDSVTIEPDASDPDGDALSYDYSGLGKNVVTATGTRSQIRFTPAVGFTGAATFRYTVSDDHGGSATAIITVNVEPSDVKLRFGATRTSPFPDRMRVASPAAGRLVNIRSRPDRLSPNDIIDLARDGQPFVAFQKTKGVMLDGDDIWYGNKLGTMWIHESGLRDIGGKE